MLKYKTYASLELDLLDFTDLNGKNIVARADKACDNALFVSARGQSFFIFPSGQRYDRKKFVRTLFKQFREKARDLTERINLNLYNDEFANKPSGNCLLQNRISPPHDREAARRRAPIWRNLRCGAGLPGYHLVVANGAQIRRGAAGKPSPHHAGPARGPVFFIT